MPLKISDEKIFQAVIKVVSEHGYLGATTKQMAKAANVSEVTLFRKFNTKLQLVKKAIAFILDDVQLESFLKYTGDIAADLVTFVSKYQQIHHKYGNFSSVIFSEIAHHPELKELFERPLQLYQAVAKLIARYQKEGILEAEDPMYAVVSLLGGLKYRNMITKIFPDLNLKQVDIEQQIMYFLKGRLKT